MERGGPQQPDWDGFDPELQRRIILSAESGFEPAQWMLAREFGITVDDLVVIQQRLQDVIDEGES